MSINNKKNSIKLFTDTDDIRGHKIRIVMAEKGVDADFIEIKTEEDIEKLVNINPSQKIPTLSDRDLVFDNSHVIIEYLDERYPHPPLMPVYPSHRAHARSAMDYINKSWYEYAENIYKGTKEEESAKILAEEISQISDSIESDYFLGKNFTLVDCYIAPILWRINDMQINLPEKAKQMIKAYSKNLFNRKAFQRSLSNKERKIGLNVNI